MKKWFRFFSLSFFSHKISKEGAKRGYSNVFLGFVLALVFLWTAFIGGDMLPFGAHYRNSQDFRETVHTVLASTDDAKRIDAKIEDGTLKVRKQGGEYTEGVLVNTFSSEADREKYSANGYNVIIDSRPANTLAEFEAYCVSNDGKNTEITYEDYLTLRDVAKLNFDFKIRYTGNALLLDGELIESCVLYLGSLGDEIKSKVEKLEIDLAENEIGRSEYDKAVYELYFTSYYPEITAYETTSKVPLLRNYYYHEYVSRDTEKYLFIFNDYVTGSFETKNGMDVQFYGFYSDLNDGPLIADGATEEEAKAAADGFIKSSFKANRSLNAYAYFMNVITLAPFIALMLIVAALLTYSVLKLNGVESIGSLGASLKIIGSYVWFSGAVSAVFTVALMFFVKRSLINALPLVLFFVTLIARSIVFAVIENIQYKKQTEQQKAEQTEV